MSYQHAKRWLTASAWCLSVRTGVWALPGTGGTPDQVQEADESDHPGLHHPLWHGRTAQVCPPACALKPLPCSLAQHAELLLPDLCLLCLLCLSEVKKQPRLRMQSCSRSCSSSAAAESDNATLLWHAQRQTHADDALHACSIREVSLHKCTLLMTDHTCLLTQRCASIHAHSHCKVCITQCLYKLLNRTL